MEPYAGPPTYTARRRYRHRNGSFGLEMCIGDWSISVPCVPSPLHHHCTCSTRPLHDTTTRTIHCMPTALHCIPIAPRLHMHYIFTASLRMHCTKHHHYISAAPPLRCALHLHCSTAHALQAHRCLMSISSAVCLCSVLFCSVVSGNLYTAPLCCPVHPTGEESGVP